MREISVALGRCHRDGEGRNWLGRCPRWAVGHLPPFHSIWCPVSMCSGVSMDPVSGSWSWKGAFLEQNLSQTCPGEVTDSDHESPSISSRENQSWPKGFPPSLGSKEKAGAAVLLVFSQRAKLPGTQATVRKLQRHTYVFFFQHFLFISYACFHPGLSG